MGILLGLIGWSIVFFIGIMGFLFGVFPALSQVNWGTVFAVIMALGVISLVVMAFSGGLESNENNEPGKEQGNSERSSGAKKIYMGPDRAPTTFQMRVSRVKYERLGDLVDNRTLRLRWMRCSIGQTWYRGGCTGEPHSLNFERARRLVTKEYPGWRIPTIGELRTVVRLKKNGPIVDPKYFPKTPPSVHFSSTKIPGKGQTILGIDFSTGLEVTCSPRKDFGFVKLVRDISRQIP
jgi:hypothetical protein